MHNEDFKDIVTWGEKGDSIIILKVFFPLIFLWLII